MGRGADSSGRRRVCFPTPEFASPKDLHLLEAMVKMVQRPWLKLPADQIRVGMDGWIRGDILIWKVQKKTQGAKL